MAEYARLSLTIDRRTVGDSAELCTLSDIHLRSNPHRAIAILGERRDVLTRQLAVRRQLPFLPTGQSLGRAYPQTSITAGQQPPNERAGQ